jgi:hypothetical protein
MFRDRRCVKSSSARGVGPTQRLVELVSKSFQECLFLQLLFEYLRNLRLNPT